MREPAILLAQFMASEPPFNILAAAAEWIADLGSIFGPYSPFLVSVLKLRSPKANAASAAIAIRAALPTSAG